MKRKFTHLHLHTPYSLLDGFTKMDDMFEKAKKLGMDSVAITDHGVMFGVIEFYKKAKQYGLKPIIGCEVYTSQRNHYNKENIDRKSGHLILLAKNNIGYRNLIKLVSIGFVKGFYYKPRIDMDLLSQYSEGLIGLSACLAGKIQQLLLANDYDGAKNVALRLENIFGHKNFYLEMQDHNIKEQKKVNILLKRLSKDAGIPLVVTNDVHYVEKEDSKSHEVLLCIQTDSTLSDVNKMEFQTDEFYFKSQDEMYDLFAGDEEALENSWKIAQKCNVNFDFNSYHIPEYNVPNEMTPYDYLQMLCYKGLKERYAKITDEITDRLEYELTTIKSMGYVEYFLIVWDFIDYAKKNNISVGPGRGSAAGSIVAYCLNITDIDPLKFNLLFERFLNPERISMPDIDVDFCYEKRELAIDYVKEKYGKDHVSQIITFGTFGAKQSIRDVARVMGISPSRANKIAKLIPEQLGITIEEALKINNNLYAQYNSNEEMKELIDVAKKIEGLPRHASTHAAGIVISKNPVDTYVPLYMSSKDNTISTQFSMNTLEELGLLKMDFLGLRTLTVIEKTLELIKENHNINIKLSSINYNDSNVYNMISEGNTIGVFQLEKPGMRKFMKELKPEVFEDIVAGVALYRPGPMDSIPQYIINKNNKSNIYYLHEKLIPILEPTNGIIIYQEQVMEIVRSLAGYSYARSDLVRRAMSKKKNDIMEQERYVFICGDKNNNINGCLKNGISEEIANKIFDQMIDFAKYAFNKSHAAAYAVISYRTAYLKHYFSVEFMTALMSSVIDNTDKIVEYLYDCKKNNIDILSLNINYSESDFTIENGKIRLPITLIKGIGLPVSENIVKERKINGDYKSFQDISDRLSVKDLNKTSAQGLIKSGALDDIIENRAHMMSKYERILEGFKKDKKNNLNGQISLFRELNENNVNKSKDDNLSINEFNKKMLLSMEKEVLGFYLSGNPLDEYQSFIKKNTNIDIESIRSLSENKNSEKLYENKEIRLCGIISSIRIISTKKDKLMSFLKIDDINSSIEVIVFPDLYRKLSIDLSEGKIVYIIGKLSFSENDYPKIIADSVQFVEEMQHRKLYIKIDTFKGNEKVKRVENYLKDIKGDVPVYFCEISTNKVYANKNHNIPLFNIYIDEIKKIVGEENCRLY